MKSIAKFAIVMASAAGFVCVGNLSAQDAAKPKADATEKSLFQKMDKNGDGKVTKDEYKEYWTFIFQDADTNKDNFVSSDERKVRAEKTLKAANTKKDGKLILKEDLVYATGTDAATDKKVSGAGNGFEAIDTDKDGFITVEEYKAYVINEFNKADTNKDGVVTVEERHALWDKNTDNMTKGRADKKSTKDEFLGYHAGK